MLSFPSFGGICETASCPVRDLSSPRVGNPRVGVSASCPVTSLCNTSITYMYAVHRQKVRVNQSVYRAVCVLQTARVSALCSSNAAAALIGVRCLRGTVKRPFHETSRSYIARTKHAARRTAVSLQRPAARLYTSATRDRIGRQLMRFIGIQTTRKCTDCRASFHYFLEVQLCTRSSLM